MKHNADLVRQNKDDKIAHKKDAIKRMSEIRYRVKSQSGNGFYFVEKTEIGWKCDCPDHKWRGMKCKHIWAAEISFGMRELEYFFNISLANEYSIFRLLLVANT